MLIGGAILKRCLVIAVLYLEPNISYAYIDPGSGILIWQGFIAAIGAALIAFRYLLRAVKVVLINCRKIISKCRSK